MRFTGLALALICSGLYGGPIASLTGTAGGQVFVDIAGPAPLTSATEFHRLFGDVSGGEATLQFGGTMKVLSSPGLFQFVFTDATIACTVGDCGNVSLDMMWSVPIDRPIGNAGPRPKPRIGEPVAPKVTFAGAVDGDFGNPKWVRISGRAESGHPYNSPDWAALSRLDLSEELGGPVNMGLRSNSTLFERLAFVDAITVKSTMTIFQMSEGDTITLPDSLVFSVSYPASTIPEPQTLALVGAAVGLLFWARRRA